MEMTREKAQAWYDALMSGKYNQVKRRLKRVEGYCCLGVYAEVVLGCTLLACGDGFEAEEAAANNAEGVAYEAIKNDIDNLSKWWSLNDTDGLSFKQIAKEVAIEYLGDKIIA